jgi:hypothetical protein
MSIKRPVSLTRPECEHEQTVVAWESMNADISREGGHTGKTGPRSR